MIRDFSSQNYRQENIIMERISRVQGVIEGNIADITQSTGHSAIISIETMDVNECKYADFTKSTGHSADIDNIDTEGTDPMDDLVASIKSCEISGKVTEFQAYLPSAWPKKQDMYVGMDTSPERYLENLYLLGRAWVQKVRHVARLTLNSSNGPI